MTPRRSRWLAVWAVLGWGCGSLPVDVDAGNPEPHLDSGVDSGLDAGAPDASAPDGGAADSGAPDAGPSDAGANASVDAGVADAGVSDAGSDAGAADAGTDGGRPRLFDGGWCPLGDGSLPAFRLRAMASNLTSGSGQSYDPGHGQRMLQAMGPDIAMMQEFNVGTNSDVDVGAFIAVTFDGGVDAGYAWYRGIGGQIPNGVVSRWPIVDAGDWVDPLVGNRAFTWVQVDLPGPRDLWVVSLHLLTSSASERSSEARAVVARLVANIPADAFLLVGGDFNTGTRTEQALTEFSTRLRTAGPWPVDQQANGNTSSTRSKPYDWVLASPCLDGLAIPVEVGSAAFPAGLVFDTRVYTPLSDVPPAQFGDSAAASMQHMGVVRDFWIQP